MANQHHDPYPGTLINDRFRVLELVSRGDTSRVYRAEQLPLGRTVALKILDASCSDGDDTSFAQRFFLEASVASKLSHPNTVAVFDYGRTERGTYFIAMEFVDGESLRSVLHREHHFSAEMVCAVAIQVARSAREAHQLQVVHRDLRPANVLLTRHGDDEDVVKVLGFGLVKPVNQGSREVTQTGVFLGSPRYMSPEHIRGEHLDGRSDVYSLGVMMYELAVGHVPFEHATAVKTLMAHMHDPVPPIESEEVPRALARLIEDCLAKRPDDRPESMDVVIARLKTLARHFRGRHPVLSSSASVPPARMRQGSGQAAQPRGSLRHAHSGAAGRRSREPGRVRRALLRTAVVLLAMAGAATFGLLGAPREDDSHPTSQGDTGPPATTQGASPLPSAETPGSTFVHVSSDPAGAEVEIDGRPYGRTPVLVELTGEWAGSGHQLTIEIRLEGYQTARVTRSIRARRVEVHAALAERLEGSEVEP